MKDRILDRAGRLTGAEFTVPSALTTRDLRGTLVHTLDVELSWRARLQREPEAGWKKALPVTDYSSVAALADHWRRDEAEMRAWLAAVAGDLRARGVALMASAATAPPPGRDP